MWARRYLTHIQLTRNRVYRQMDTVESKDTLTTFEEYVKGMIVEEIRKYEMNQKIRKYDMNQIMD